MSEAQRQTRIIYDAFCSLVEDGTTAIRPGDVIDFLRAKEQPLGIWHVNGEFTKLAKLGLIKVDLSSAKWHLISECDFDEAVERVNGEWESI